MLRWWDYFFYQLLLPGLGLALVASGLTLVDTLFLSANFTGSVGVFDTSLPRGGFFRRSFGLFSRRFFRHCFQQRICRSIRRLSNLQWYSMQRKYVCTSESCCKFAGRKSQRRTLHVLSWVNIQTKFCCLRTIFFATSFGESHEKNENNHHVRIRFLIMIHFHEKSECLRSGLKTEKCASFPSQRFLIQSSKNIKVKKH